MKKYRTVEPFMEPNLGLAALGLHESVAEMTAGERGFLCGLIRDRRPKKIVEVGVAEGGTTTVILECVRELELDCAVYSVDLSESFYLDADKSTGYVVDVMAERGGPGVREFLKGKHHLMLGKILPERIDDIGDEIDFLILDTMHTMPGEILDFITAFPYLSHDAVVVLHDTRYHYIWRGQVGIATSVLLQSVAADKFLNNQEGYPNIAAFQLNGDTAEYMLDVFCALMIRWSYLPLDEHLRSYEAAITRHYDAQCLQIFHQAKDEAKNYHIQWKMPRYGGFWHVLLYGNGNRGKKFLQQCVSLGIKIDGFVVSDDFLPVKAEEKPVSPVWNPDPDGPAGYGLKLQAGVPPFPGERRIPVYPYSRIPFKPEETLIIQTSQAPEVTQRLQASDWRWIDLPGSCWKELGFQ